MKSYPFIDIPLPVFIDNSIISIQNLFEKHIYENKNGLGSEKECENTVNFYVNKYTILEMPLILSFNIN